MKNFFEEHAEIGSFIKIWTSIFSFLCVPYLLFDLGLSFGGLGSGKMDSSFIFFVFLINYQLFLLMISLLTLTVVLPKVIMLSIGGLIVFSPMTFFNFEDGLGSSFHLVIIFIGVMYIVSKFYENGLKESNFLMFKGLTLFLIGINGLNTLFYFNLLNAYFSPDVYHLVMNLGLIITMIIAPILIGILLFIPVKKWLEYLIGFCLLFSAIMFLFVTDDLISPSIITGAIALIFLSYITFFQNEKYQNQ